MDIETIDLECLIQPSNNMDIDNGNSHNNEIFEENELVGNSQDELEERESIVPEEGMLFSSQDEAYNFYNRYALKMGFGIRKSSTSYSRSDKSKINGRKYKCDKEGKRKSLTENNIEIDGSYIREIRMGCNAMMGIRLTESGSWKVATFVSQHNHEMSTPSKTAKHRSHKKVHRQPIVKKLMTQLHSDGISNANIARVVNTFEPDQNHIITSQQVHDHLRIEKNNNLGKNCAIVVNHFLNKKAKDAAFFFNIEVDDDYALRSMFWADRRSQETYKKFSDVIIFDVTYRTNNFSLPFAPFTGINHHRQSSLFGCALLADETEDTFVWLFEQWLLCMGGKEPTIIITDQDAAMGNAIAKLFPNTLHRFCEWHLKRNIAENLVHLKATHGPDIELDFDKIHSSDTIDEAEKCWNELMTKYDLREKSWLPKLWERRKSWVPCYLKDTFVAGTRSSQRSESINSFFDTYVNAMTPLHEFIVQYDKALASRRRAEEDADFNTMNSKPVSTLNWSLEEKAGKSYTTNLFNLLHKEMKDALKYWEKKIEKEGTITRYKVGLQRIEESKWRIVNYDSNGDFVSCQCKYFETHGLLCRHALCILLKKRVLDIPDRYVLKRWTIDCRFQSDDAGLKEDAITTVVDRDLVWGIRYKLTKVLNEVYKSTTSAEEFDRYLTSFLAKVDQRSIRIEDETVPLLKYSSSKIPEIMVRDPTEAAKTKGRPKQPSRLQSSLEIHQEEDDTKKRTCGHCGGKGHYRTGCPIVKETKKRQRE